MADILVTSLADNEVAGDGLTTLREAVVMASANSESDKITFATAGTLALTAGVLTPTGKVTIDGDVDGDGVSDVTIDAGGTSGTASKRAPLRRWKASASTAA